MPELPDLTLYVEALTRQAVGRRIERGDGKAAQGAGRSLTSSDAKVVIRPLAARYDI